MATEVWKKDSPHCAVCQFLPSAWKAKDVHSFLLLLLLLLGTFYFLSVFKALHQQMDILNNECYLDIKTSRKSNFSKIQKYVNSHL